MYCNVCTVVDRHGWMSEVTGVGYLLRLFVSMDELMGERG